MVKSAPMYGYGTALTSGSATWYVCFQAKAVPTWAGGGYTSADASLFLSAMPTQDAIDLARFLVETTIGFCKFWTTRQPKTVGGPIEIAAITKHEGFRWVQRKLFYPAEFNP